jgi:hypothetical protein
MKKFIEIFNSVFHLFQQNIDQQFRCRISDIAKILVRYQNARQIFNLTVQYQTVR